MIFHQPVLCPEAVSLLHPLTGKIFLDATLGHAGHTLPLLQSGATVFGLDADKNNLAVATQRIADLKLSAAFHPLHGNFKNILTIWKKYIHTPLDGLMFDLGLSRSQQSASNRGFSFNDPVSLDMRLDPTRQQITAEEIVNTASEDELFTIFSKISQEPYSRPLAQRIIRQRQRQPIKSGQALADIIRRFYQDRKIKSFHDPATKIFMALRITVNHEFASLTAALRASLKIVKPLGRVVVITFHSGEDRLVKNFIRHHHLVAQKLSPKPDEIRLNPLSRSATLRTYTISNAQ